MKFIFILIDKREIKNITGFYDRREMLLHEAERLNSALTNSTLWIITPNY